MWRADIYMKNMPEKSEKPKQIKRRSGQSAPVSPAVERHIKLIYLNHVISVD